MIEARSWGWYAAAGALLLVGAFLAGRFSNPTRVEERVRVQVVEKQVVAIQERVRVETVTVEKTTHQLQVVEREVVRPDGTIERTREEKAQATSDNSSQSTAAKESEAKAFSSRDNTEEASKIATYELPRWRLGGTAGVNPFDRWKALYGGEAGVRVAGPFWLNLSGRTDGNVALTLAIEF